MTQQELFDKLKQCLEPLGFGIKLTKDWRSGEVQIAGSRFSIFSHAFTYKNLLKQIDSHLEEMREDQISEDDSGFTNFLQVLASVLETFPEDAQETTIEYTFNTDLFDYLRSTLAEKGITVYQEEDSTDARHSKVLFKAIIEDTEVCLISIFGRCFDLEGLNREIRWTTEDSEFLEYSDNPEFIQYLTTIRDGLHAYKEKILLMEVQNLLNGN